MGVQEIQISARLEKVVDLGIMIRRWAVLTDKYLFTFKKKQVYRNPTEKIDFSKCAIPQCADAMLLKTNSIVSCLAKLADQEYGEEEKILYQNKRPV